MKADDTIEGRYRIERLLREGGMGKVYLAHDLALDKKVAIKTLLPLVAADIRSVERLKTQARQAGRANAWRSHDAEAGLSKGR